MQAIKLDIRFPDVMGGLFAQARYKVFHGGRGSGKSWSVARALLLLAAQKKTRVLCAREVQKSIKESVHKLLSDQIAAMGLGQHFVVLETAIRCSNGSEFTFSGLGQHTVDSIKSFEGVDVCWVEEGQTVSKRSWDVLVPTIRQPGSEIWITLNPELETDDTYVRFIASPPPNSIVQKVNWSDNPWFPKELENERLHCFLTNRADYDNIWEGKARSSITGAIYAHEVETMGREQRIRAVPYDAMMKVHVVFDLGWNDSMTLSFVQRSTSEIRVIDYIEDDHKTLDWYAAEIRNRRYNLGKIWLPHDGEHKDFKTGKSARELMQAMGFDVEIVPSVSIEDGIRTLRQLLGRFYIDELKAARLVVCLRRYRRFINLRTQEPGQPLHDEFSHGADNGRYIALVADLMSNAPAPGGFKRRGSAMAV